MKEDTVKIILSVVFVIAMFLYINLVGIESSTDVANEEQIDAMDTVENEVMNEPDILLAPPIINEINPDTDLSGVEIPSFLDSFNEDALEGEFDDVQAGIDLLNNPLQ